MQKIIIIFIFIAFSNSMSAQTNRIFSLTGNYSLISKFNVSGNTYYSPMESGQLVAKSDYGFGFEYQQLAFKNQNIYAFGGVDFRRQQFEITNYGYSETDKEIKNITLRAYNVRLGIKKHFNLIENKLDGEIGLSITNRIFSTLGSPISSYTIDSSKFIPGKFYSTVYFDRRDFSGNLAPEISGGLSYTFFNKFQVRGSVLFSPHEKMLFSNIVKKYVQVSDEIVNEYDYRLDEILVKTHLIRFHLGVSYVF